MSTKIRRNKSKLESILSGLAISANVSHSCKMVIVMSHDVGNSVVFTGRKRSLRRLCFYTCLSVHGRVSGQVHPPGKYTPLSGQIHPPGQVHPTSWAGTPPRQVHPPGRYTPQQVHSPGRYTPGAGTPPTLPREQCMLGDAGNKRAVRILLECILVNIASDGPSSI